MTKIDLFDTVYVYLQQRAKIRFISGVPNKLLLFFSNQQNIAQPFLTNGCTLKYYVCYWYFRCIGNLFPKNKNEHKRTLDYVVY